jgi:chromosome segregation protein
MKLQYIRLAGFKSFVDPTTLELKSELVSIVGPNGCGKSNVIDAVRWVMGESSAKNLRGGSMADVIFNGSTTRKPIGQASVELEFDNQDGSLGGEYASYAKIVIRREVTRDGQSNYYFNGTKCTRKTIIDNFSGTGLGPRSYSIIEQGMVNRVIEAKPEELRNFFEEAAGVAIYKKRRHETELRMRNTTENLARISDLLQEQGKNLEKLKRQSAAASKYKEYDAAKTIIEGQLIALRWQHYDQDLTKHSNTIREYAVTLEQKLASKASIDNELETVRVTQTDKAELLDEVQGRYYEFGTQIARVEQNIQNKKERQQLLENDVAQVKANILDITSQQAEDSSELENCNINLEKIIPQYENAKEQREQADLLYSDLQERYEAWNETWNDFTEQSANSQHKTSLCKQQLEQLSRDTNEISSKIKQLEKEDQGLDNVLLKDKANVLSTDLNELEIRDHSINELLAEHKSSLQVLKDELNIIVKEHYQYKNQIQQLSGKQASLEALQQAALNKDDKKFDNWLKQNNIVESTRLAETFKVIPGYEAAVEAVLADYLQAIYFADKPADLMDILQQVSDLDVSCVYDLTHTSANVSNDDTDAKRLTSCIQTQLDLSNIFGNILVVDNLEQALALLPKLQADQSVVTKDGIWLNNSWVRVRKQQDPKRQVLTRASQLEEIAAQLVQLNDLLEDAVNSIDDKQASIGHAEDEVSSLLRQQQDLNSQLRDISSQYSGLKVKLEQIEARKSRIQKELVEYNARLDSNSAKEHELRQELEISIEHMANFENNKESLLFDKQELLVQLQEAKSSLYDAQSVFHALELQRQKYASAQEAIINAVARVNEQLIKLNERKQQLIQQLENNSMPDNDLYAQLEELLSRRSDVEEELSIARQAMEAIDFQIKDLEKARNQYESQALKIREQLDQARLAWQAIKTRKETIDEQLEKLALNIQDLIANLPEGLEEKKLVVVLNEMEEAISKLGAINLAAIEEYDSELEREQYLTSQHNDLREALETLENAIRKIDKETKQKFKDTFDIIQTNFSNLFPKLFGGGKAALELVGDDLLAAGIAVTAMPPGKKNSSIQLLSGGEKTLTAVALVFSIFQLNPSPFCMLDEVDAPLDDSNVGRLCKLLQHMSDKVQFIFITHNKLTMEISKQLVGVTMKEPGVSRIVTVDIAEAMELAEA